MTFSEYSIFLPADGICCLTKDFIFLAPDILQHEGVKSFSLTSVNLLIAWFLPQDNLWHWFCWKHLSSVSTQMLFKSFYSHWKLQKLCIQVRLWSLFWRQLQLQDDLSNWCHSAIPFSFIHSTSASSLNLLRLAAFREHCWVNSTVFGWGSERSDRGKRKLCVPTSLDGLFMYRHIFMARCITTQLTLQQVLCTMESNRAFSRPLWSSNNDAHVYSIGCTLDFIRNTRSSLDLSLFLYIQTGKVSKCVGGWSRVCLLAFSRQGIVGKQAQRRCWSITGRGAVMVGCQATGREKQQSVWRGLLGGGSLSFSPPSPLPVYPNTTFSFTPYVSAWLPRQYFYPAWSGDSHWTLCDCDVTMLSWANT